MPFHETVLPNGLRLLYRRTPGLPLAAATMLLPGGSVYESVAQAGLCSLTHEMLLQGTRDRSARRIADDLESMGAFMGTQAAEDYAEAGFIVPVPRLRGAMAMLLELLTKPSFPEAELAKERAQVLSSLATRRDTIFNIAHDRLAERLFGSHPYGRLVDGLPGTVQRFKRRDLQAWHAAYVAPAGAILSIVASVPWPEVLAETKRTLGRWRKNGAAWRSPALFLPAALSASVEEEIRAPFEQAYLMTGMLAPKADDPDFFALKLLNTALGGGMSSRLFLQLREERGLAYEVSSFFATRLQASQWVIYLGCSPKNLDVAQRHLEALLRQVASEGVSAMELKQAKAMMKGSFALDFQTRRRQAWYGAWWRFLGRGAHYERRFGPAVDAVQSADVRRAARRLLSQPRVTIKVVPKG